MAIELLLYTTSLFYVMPWPKFCTDHVLQICRYCSPKALCFLAGAMIFYCKSWRENHDQDPSHAPSFKLKYLKILCSFSACFVISLSMHSVSWLWSVKMTENLKDLREESSLSVGIGHEWDVDLYGKLLETGGGKERMTAYFSVSPNSIIWNRDKETIYKCIGTLRLI